MEIPKDKFLLCYVGNHGSFVCRRKHPGQCGGSFSRTTLYRDEWIEQGNLPDPEICPTARQALVQCAKIYNVSRGEIFTDQNRTTVCLRGDGVFCARVTEGKMYYTETEHE